MIKSILLFSFVVASFLGQAMHYSVARSACLNDYNCKTDTSYFLKSVGAKKASKIVKQNLNNPQFTILDVRTANEYNIGHISNAINLNFKSSNFQEDLDKLDKSKIYLVYCTAGYRSKKTALMMKEKKFTSIYNMKGGMMNWKAKRLPVDEPKQ